MLGVIAMVGSVALAAPTAQNFTNIQPFITDTYDNGTSTNEWLHVFAKNASTTNLSVSSNAQVGGNIIASNFLGTSTDPIIIFTSGQSNFTITNSYNWTPASNLLVWNHAEDTTTTGTAFVTPQSLGYSTSSNVPVMFASNVALQNPTRKVYLINVSYSAQHIAQWMSGASAPDMYTATRANVAAALAAIPNSSKISIFAWWQGEADSDNSSLTQYKSDLDTVMNAYNMQTWFSTTTPEIFFGLNSQTNPLTPATFGFDHITEQIRQVVAEQTAQRKFVYTGDLLFDYSLTIPGIHLGPIGQLTAAQRAFNVYQLGYQESNIASADDGNVLYPGYGFFNEPSTGMYRITTGTLGFGIQGVPALTVSPTAITGLGSMTLGSTSLANKLSLILNAYGSGDGTATTTYNSMIGFGAMRSDSANGTTVLNRGYLVMPGATTTTAADFFIGANTSSVGTSGDANSLHSNQSSIDINSGGLVDFWRLGTNYVRLNGSGASYFNGGNVGIGTVNPSATLDVELGTAGANGVIKFAPGGTGNNRTMTFNTVNDATGAYGGINVTGTNNGVGGNIVLNLSGGSVGIGTSSPFAKLSITGAAGGAINLFAISTSTSAFATSTALRVSSNGNLHFMNGTGIDIGMGSTPPANGLIVAGNVGIGTSTPTAKLVSVAASTTAGTIQTPYNGVVEIIAGLENTVTMLFQEIDQWGDLITSGDTPSVTGGTSSVSGNQRNGLITVTGTALTSLTLTWVHPWPVPPDCTVSDNTTASVVDITSISATQLVIGLSIGVNSANVWYICQAHQ